MKKLSLDKVLTGLCSVSKELQSIIGALYAEHQSEIKNNLHESLMRSDLVLAEALLKKALELCLYKETVKQ